MWGNVGIYVKMVLLLNVWFGGGVVVVVVVVVVVSWVMVWMF